MAPLLKALFEVSIFGRWRRVGGRLTRLSTATLWGRDWFEEEQTTIKEYKYRDETFQLDDSKGCYVEVTYK